MNNLVLFDSLDLSKASNEDFYTTTEIIAERTGNGYKEISNLVRKYQEQLKNIAPLTWHFESPRQTTVEQQEKFTTSTSNKPCFLSHY